MSHANHTESLRAKLKPSWRTGVLAEAEPGLFTLARPATSDLRHQYRPPGLGARTTLLLRLAVEPRPPGAPTSVPGSIFRIDWRVPADYDERSEVDIGARDARIRAVIGDRPYSVVWSSVYRFHSRLVDRMCVARVLLAGDLAHLVSPFSARAA